ncbi:DUF1249 domain-containing protein [Aestuariirhabdus litorea]|uniref:DUF1249 domain-containing protein n=1 Tax=Aestuariirhabdus litorea TaxID=2528527 RepID=A0A3P3VKE0_9GAMM|nr:DUF1249 domain-containing protein [Aestuariirhabdus litorea]RRJ82338.1 DUF1249 domain-containing protein [Aestuariirhabdus litorea]RWW92503.1 DUF1249 domain-containing protein [Endozoicomonadaceae bacterium GTF-13]
MTTAAARKPRYQIDLVAQQALCERNYARLLKLLPQWDQADEHCFAVRFGEHSARVRLLIQQRCPYTSMVEISHQADWGQWLPLPLMEVRVYHDLRMAEVVSALDRPQRVARHDYPNQRMELPDEKAQWNRFLGEWLSHCLEGGCSLEPWQAAAM